MDNLWHCLIFFVQIIHSVDNLFLDRDDGLMRTTIGLLFIVRLILIFITVIECVS